MRSRLDDATRAELNGLMIRLADGDRAAFQPLFLALWPRVRSWCMHLLAHTHDAEDVTQQALLKLFAQANRFYPEGDVLTWALTLATWECRSHRRRIQRHAALIHTETSLLITPEDQAVQDDLKHALEELVGELSKSDQHVLQMARDQDTSEPFSATLRKRRQRAIGRLKKLWRSRHGNT